MEKYLKMCIDAVKTAAGICREIQMQLVDEDALTKNDRSPVTVADFASQAVICRTLHRHFPDVPVVGEEDARDLQRPENRDLLKRIAHFLPGWSDTGIVAAVDEGTGSPGSLFFTLDPIDGTKGFLRGDQYAVALSLIRDGKVVLGVLGCPNLVFGGNDTPGTITWAQSGKGAFGQPLSGGETDRLTVSRNDGTGTVRFLESVESGHANHGQQAQIMGAFGDRRQSVRIDSQAKYLMLAQGGAEVYLRMPSPKTPDYREKIWDHAAGSIIVQEAGGKVTDINGNPLDFSAGKRLVNNTGVIGTNGRLHEAIVDRIAGGGDWG